MAAFQGFNVLTEDLARGRHQFQSGGHTYKLLLTNTAPTATQTEQGQLTEISPGNGYPAGGPTVSLGISRTGDQTDITGSNVNITASGGSIGPFRYAVLYNDTTSGKPLVAFWDRGSALTLEDGESLQVEVDVSGVVFDVSFA